MKNEKGELMIDLRHGDCLEVMKDIPDGSIDMVLCDLPYGVTQNKWDCVIDIDKLWVEYRRILKKKWCDCVIWQTTF